MGRRGEGGEKGRRRGYVFKGASGHFLPTLSARVGATVSITFNNAEFGWRIGGIRTCRRAHVELIRALTGLFVTAI